VILKNVPRRRTGVWAEIRDSKLLCEIARTRLAEFIRSQALCIGIGQASHTEIDRLNIHHASLLSMRRAVQELKMAPQLILIDGKFTIPNLPHKQRSLINGDETELVISCASIIAKVYRDELMKKLAERFSEYGFEKHKGYGTKLHRNRLRKYGPCPVHRMTFGPVKDIISRREG